MTSVPDFIVLKNFIFRRWDLLAAGYSNIPATEETPEYWVIHLYLNRQDTAPILLTYFTEEECMKDYNYIVEVQTFFQEMGKKNVVNAREGCACEEPDASC